MTTSLIQTMTRIKKMIRKGIKRKGPPVPQELPRLNQRRRVRRNEKSNKADFVRKVVFKCGKS